MARIFLSYHSSDHTLAISLQQALEQEGHEIKRVNELAPGDRRREVLFATLGSSDAMVVLLSRKALASRSVIAEIGSARAFNHLRRLLLFPVIVGTQKVPEIIEDLHAIRVAGDNAKVVRDAAASIDQALVQHFRSQGGAYPPIFISHRHKDEDVARALAHLLEAGLVVESQDIRCTSVDPYRMLGGQRTSDRLRSEISRAQVVLGILTPDTKESSYVLFELGASWGQNIQCLPLLAKHGTVANVPDPIKDLHVLDLSNHNDCGKLIGQVAQFTGLKPRADPRAGGQVAQAAHELVMKALGSTTVTSSPSMNTPAATPSPANKMTSSAGLKRPRKSAVGSETAARRKLLKDMLEDPRYANGRYLTTLSSAAELSPKKCEQELRAIRAREITLGNGEVVWTL